MATLTVIRALLFRLWPILLIILAFWVLYWFVCKKGKDNEKLPPWQTKLWLSTFAAAIFLLLVSVALMVFNFEDNADKKYIPAHVEDGKLIKGKMVPENADR